MGMNMALMAIAAPTAASRAPRRWINGPWVDFLTLGSGSFLVLGALAAFWPRDDASRAALAGAMLLLAHVVNHPHFAHSYQLFYREFHAQGLPRRNPARRAAGAVPVNGLVAYAGRDRRRSTGPPGSRNARSVQPANE